MKYEWLNRFAVGHGCMVKNGRIFVSIRSVTENKVLVDTAALNEVINNNYMLQKVMYISKVKRMPDLHV